MTASPNETSYQEIGQIWKSRWRASGAARAQRLAVRAEMAAMGHGCEIGERGEFLSGNDRVRVLYEDVMTNARIVQSCAAEKKTTWWTSSRYGEFITTRLHLADVQLVDLLPDDQLWGDAPRILSVIRDYLPAEDSRRIWVEDCFSVKVMSCDEFRISPEDRQRVVGALQGAYFYSGLQRGRLRNFQSGLYVTAGLLVTLLLALAILGAVAPNLIPLCFQPAGDIPEVCATGGVPHRVDVALIEVIGVAAATLAAVVSLSGRNRVVDPYIDHGSQAAAKIAAGAATALLGVLFLSTSTLITDQPQILVYAAVFGYAQELFTRFIDAKGDSLREAAMPSDSPSTVRQ